MPLLPFQSGYKAQIQTVRTHTCALAVPIGSHTNTFLPHKCAVWPSVVRPSVPFDSWLFNPTEGTRHGFVEQTVLHLDVMCGHATQTSIAKFPTKPGEPCMHEQWIPCPPL